VGPPPAQRRGGAVRGGRGVPRGGGNAPPVQPGGGALFWNALRYPARLIALLHRNHFVAAVSEDQIERRRRQRVRHQRLAGRERAPRDVRKSQEDEERERHELPDRERIHDPRALLDAANVDGHEREDEKRDQRGARRTRAQRWPVMACSCTTTAGSTRMPRPCCRAPIERENSDGPPSSVVRVKLPRSSISHSSSPPRAARGEHAPSISRRAPSAGSCSSTEPVAGASRRMST